MNFSEEQFNDETIEELKQIIVGHINEVGPFQFEFNVDWPNYLRLQTAGVSRLFVVRERGDMVGYAVYFMTPHNHFASTIFAIQDSIYIHPDSRGGGNGTRFIAFCEENLSDSCDAVTQSVTPELDYSDTLLKNGYTPLEMVYVKSLVRKE